MFVAQRQASAALIPIHDSEGLFESKQLLEAARLVDDRQTGTELHQQQHRIRDITPAHSDPLRCGSEVNCL